AGPSVYALEHAGWEDLDVGDINGDGRPDVVVSSGQGYADKTLAILPQQADGSFGNPRYSSIGSTSWAVAVGDVNGDGRNDVIVSRAYESSIGVFYQDASGPLGPMQIVGTYNTIYAIEVADVNGDGAQDVVVKTGYGFGVLFQQPDGSLGPVQTYRAGLSGSFNPHSITVGDINGDGWPDLVGAGLAYVLNRGPDATSTRASATKSVTKAPSKRREALNSRGWAPMRDLPGKPRPLPGSR
ncbi:MAG TPA: VCBS repeat-containing protein, partial [Burkholderiaceae bacterium]|nr:VCBS repeat-containing protein [Burkholderiaceae bacterium]